MPLSKDIICCTLSIPTRLTWCMPFSFWNGFAGCAHLITVGVISAQKKILRLLTAWEENMPMMENATEKLVFSVSDRSERKEGKREREREDRADESFSCLK